jgi:hypothetical protein
MWKTLALGAGFALIASTAMAQAQPQCNERDNVLALLAKKYKETPIAAGVTNTGGLVEVLTDIKSGTWTIIVTTPQGMSCLVAAGEGWRNMEQIALEPEA